MGARDAGAIATGALAVSVKVGRFVDDTEDADENPRPRPPRSFGLEERRDGCTLPSSGLAHVPSTHPLVTELESTPEPLVD